MLDRAFKNPLEIEEQATLPFVGGIRQYGYQCGQVWGAALAAGAKVHQEKGAGAESQTRVILAAQKITNTFRNENGEVNCQEITSLHKESTTFDMVKYFLLKGGSISCFRMASNYAPKAYDDIEETLAEDLIDVPQLPLACTAKLAKQMDAEDRHQTMSASLAGGIGLSGEACGALGTALWIKAMQKLRENPDIDLWKDPDFSAEFEVMVEKFLAASNYEFECANIVGRKFDSPQDHAEFIQGGGCAGILDALAKD